MDIKVVSIKYGWSTIVLAKIRYLRHFVQNLLGVKVHTSYKISKFQTHIDKIFGILIFFILKKKKKKKNYIYYQVKNQVGFPSLYINLTIKLLIKS